MILVSILGDFHSSILPIYYRFRNNINRHIIIYDDLKSDKQEAQNLIKGIKTFNKKYNIKIKTYIHCIDEDSYEAITKTIDFIKDHLKKKQEVYINTTDGLSNINTIISLKLIPLGAKLISYDRYDNDINIVDKNNMTSYNVDQTIPILDHFLLRNIIVEQIGDKQYAKKYQNEILMLFEKYAKEFKSFTYYVQNEINPTLNNNKYKKINKILKKMNITNLKSNQGFITGGLFEYYIYLKLKDLDFDDIQIGVTVKKYLNKTDYIPNEFDILIMKNNHLHMIECKYSKRVELDSLVYKYMGLKPLLDDDGKMCIVTRHDEPENIYQLESPVAHLPYKRALENKILLKGDPLKDIKKFVKDIKDYFEL